MNCLTLLSANNYFKQHPEKVAGTEYETSSIFFPIMVKGTKEDVLRVTGMNGKKRLPKAGKTMKQPWEMPLKEFLNAVELKQSGYDNAVMFRNNIIIKNQTERQFRNMTDYETYKKLLPLKNIKNYDENIVNVQDILDKHNISFDTYYDYLRQWDRGGDIFTVDYHKNQIKQALEAGKPVPQSVLQDYPDLAKNDKSKTVKAKKTFSYKYKVDDKVSFIGQGLSVKTGVVKYLAEPGFYEVKKGKTLWKVKESELVPAIKTARKAKSSKGYKSHSGIKLNTRQEFEIGFVDGSSYTFFASEKEDAILEAIRHKLARLSQHKRLYLKTDKAKKLKLAIAKAKAIKMKLELLEMENNGNDLLGITAYHGTNNQFDKFDVTSDISFHFGTKEQAKKMGKYIKEVELDIKNPLYMIDMIRWDAYVVAKLLFKYLVITKVEFEKIQKAKLHDKQRKVLVDIIKSKGYDSIMYDNEFEAKGKSYIVFDSKKIKDKGNKETLLGFPGILQQVKALFIMAKNNNRPANKKDEKIIISPIYNASAMEILEKTGIDLKGYKRVVDYSALRHIFNKHYGTNEKSTKNTPLTTDDIVYYIDTVTNFDEVTKRKNRKAQDVIRYVKNEVVRVSLKRYYINTIVVEEVRTGKKELCLLSMYKTKRSKKD